MLTITCNSYHFSIAILKHCIHRYKFQFLNNLEFWAALAMDPSFFFLSDFLTLCKSIENSKYWEVDFTIKNYLSYTFLCLLPLKRNVSMQFISWHYYLSVGTIHIFIRIFEAHLSWYCFHIFLHDLINKFFIIHWLCYY